MLLLKGFSIKQQVFDRGIPTPLLLYNFLKMSMTLILSVSLNDDNVYNPWKESSDVKVGFIEVWAQNACNKVYCTLYFSCLHITFSPIFVKVIKDAVCPTYSGFKESTNRYVTSNPSANTLFCQFMLVCYGTPLALILSAYTSSGVFQFA